jgi:hypothetical protein
VIVDVVAELKALLDESGGSVFWTSTHLLNALNQALMDIDTDLKSRIVQTSLSLPTNADIVALPTTTILMPTRIFNEDGDIFPVKQIDIERYSSQWKQAHHERPKWFTLWDAEHIRVFPSPDQDYTFTIVGVGWPTEITLLAPTVENEHPYIHALIFKAAATLVETTLPLAAQMYMQEYEEHMVEYRKNYRNRGDYPIYQLRPGNKLQSAQGMGMMVSRRF